MWVDVGMYTTGQVVGVDGPSGQYVKVRFGDDEVRELNRGDQWIKHAAPEPGRSLARLFRPGQWVWHRKFGKGFLIDVSTVVLTVRFMNAIRRIAPMRDRLFVEPMDCPDQDLMCPVETRRTFFLRHKDRLPGLSTCQCCGYPTAWLDPPPQWA